MAKSRKTVSVDALLNYVNGYLSADFPTGDSAEAISRREGAIDMIEMALNAIDRYRGYSYLDDKVVTTGKPGIRWIEGGGHTFENTDNTRRRYA